ncbi:uncharacterized protein LOC128963167 [Oppia nitens]|uniref:uncharacterized protein LOC128963167 n=1 Tax=Oppia nitens TaxID=1686743 RepID=UPI0023D98460|nr:uncharacterized protein LOC128963167 [Oppia nitens]
MMSNDMPKFWSLFKQIIGRVLDNMLSPDIQQLRPQLEKMIDYFFSQYNTVDYGRMYILGYRLLTNGKCNQQSVGAIIDSNNKDEDNEPVYAMAVAVELVTMSLFLLDDIMDKSTQKFGKPCWYTLPSVGMSAINDSTIMLAIVDKIVEIYYKNHCNYVQIVHCIHEFIEKISIGQALDMTNSVITNKSIKITDYNMDLYNKINKYKNSFSGFVYQFKLAMIITDSKLDNNESDIVEEFLIQTGILCGAMNDYQDYYEESTGTDIQEGKCTWLFVRALQLANDRQRTELLANYGHNDTDRIEIIRQLYSELDIPAEMLVFADSVFTGFRQLATGLGNKRIVDIVDNFANAAKEYGKNVCHLFQ